MALTFNGVSPEHINYNGNSLKQVDVIFNGERTTVWKLTDELAIMPPYPPTLNFKKGATGVNCKVDFYDDYVRVYGYNNQRAYMEGLVDIDFSKYSKAVIKYEAHGSVSGGYARMFCASSGNEYVNIPNTSSRIVETEFDISSFNGTGILRFMSAGYSNNSSFSLRLYEIKLIA